MILTPGIAFTMGIRDFVQGDYLSGTIRMIDALLIAASIAIGTGLVLSSMPFEGGGRGMTELLFTGEQLGRLALQFLLAGAGTLSFAILFACPRRTLPYCGLVGAVGWLVYEIAELFGMEAFAASLLAVIPLTLLARILAMTLRAPVTVFLLTGIFPLVPVRASITVPTTSFRATTLWRWQTASLPSRSPWRWPWALRLCWASPCRRNADKTKTRPPTGRSRWLCRSIQRQNAMERQKHRAKMYIYIKNGPLYV